MPGGRGVSFTATRPRSYFRCLALVQVLRPDLLRSGRRRHARPLDRQRDTANLTKILITCETAVSLNELL